ncbi:MAG: S8 family serine peptidase [Aeromicrobium sp.]
MKRLALLATVVMAIAVLPAPTAQADNPVPAWARKTTSLTLSPANIVKSAPDGEPLKVVITRRTAGGPASESIIATSETQAKQLIADAQKSASTIGVGIAQPVHIVASNDTYRSKQWALNTLKAETAWASAVGNGVTVAVVDTGVQSSHPDLSGKVLSGYDVVAPGTAATDQNGHGTHVAGIVAAVAGNARGIAGLARGSKILPVRVLDSNGDGDTADLAEGIRWAANHDAKVINVSLESAQSDPATQSAVAYAVSKNVVVVAAAGNNGCGLKGSGPSYPASYPNVMGVASTNSDNGASGFSACGPSVDVAAPGGVIISTTILNSVGLGCSSTSAYCTLSGTSMASPHAAAAAALAIEEIGPTWTQAGVRSLLASTATDLGSAGRDNTFGDGLINPVRVLRHINTHFVMTLPTANITAGDNVKAAGKILTTDGSAVPNVPVTLSATLDGTRYSWPLTTDSTGKFAKDVSLPHNATFTAHFAGNGSNDDTTRATTFAKVAPRWSYSHTASTVLVTNHSLYGQKLSLQQKSGTTWKTVSSVAVTEAEGSATAGKGTWRLYSAANSKVIARTSGTWTN